MFHNLRREWDLDSIFPGGSKSPQFARYLDELENDIKDLSSEVSRGPSPTIESWIQRITQIQALSKRLRQSGSFVSCLNAQDVNDTNARILAARVSQLRSAFNSLMAMNDRHLVEMSDDQWRVLLDQEPLKPVAFNLNERRERARDKLPVQEEILANLLSPDGYHGWSDLYDVVTGKMTITIELNGRTETLSPGQLQNRLSDPDPRVRAYLMGKWEEAWSQVADLCALALNHLSGFRLALYEKRGWDSFLKEPLENNRMSQKTLDAMWRTIEENRDRLVTYLKRKKRYLGLDKLGWQDYGAPIATSQTRITYDEAAELIVEELGRISPKMASLAERAFRENWIESADRPGKRMGGFCTSFPESQVSRVFVTFSGTLGNVATVAHELGHAFHQSVMNDIPPMAQQYAMNVAETASTFSELVISDAALRKSKSRKERLVLLDDKLSRAVDLLMNIHSRYLFETSFYSARKNGMVSTEKLNDLMLEAQKEAFGGALDLYHPHFWASKLHFYNTGTPFYNFPYTFGFLFSSGIYARAKQEGSSFEEKYINLLRDTGRMKVEDLAMKHLGVDLTQSSFWQSAIDSALEDLPEFMELTE